MQKEGCLSITLAPPAEHDEQYINPPVTAQILQPEHFFVRIIHFIVSKETVDALNPRQLIPSHELLLLAYPRGFTLAQLLYQNAPLHDDAQWVYREKSFSVSHVDQ